MDDTFPKGNIAPGSGACVVICLWGHRTDKCTGRWTRMTHPSHSHYSLGQEGEVESTSLTSSQCVCVCPLFVLRQVSDLVLIEPIPEDIFEEDQWKEYW